jgi:hypothetical protein
MMLSIDDRYGLTTKLIKYDEVQSLARSVFLYFCLHASKCHQSGETIWKDNDDDQEHWATTSCSLPRIAICKVFGLATNLHLEISHIADYCKNAAEYLMPIEDSL